MKIKIWLFVAYLIFGANAKIFTKFIDVKEDQLKPGGEEVRFKDSILKVFGANIISIRYLPGFFKNRKKFRLGKSRTDKPELMLIAAQNWIPIRVIIEGRARRMTVMYMYKGFL